MPSIFKKTASILALFGLLASSLFFNIKPIDTAVGSTIPTPVAQFQTSLASSIGANDTSMTLVSATDKSGTSLASSTYGFIIDEGTGSDEFVLANCTGTACTGMTRGISVTTGTTSVASLKKAHRRGASVKITDAPLLLILARINSGLDGFPNKLKYDTTPTLTSAGDIAYKDYVDTAGASSTNYANSTFIKLAGSQTVTSTNTWSNTQTFSTSPVIPSPTNGTDAANKAYIDAAAIAGGVIANNTTTGIQRVATSTQIATGYSSSTAYAIPSSLASSTASTTSIVVATKSSTGKIDPTFLNGSSESYTFNGTTTVATSTYVGSWQIFGDFGDGRDGNVTIAGGATTTLSRDMYYNNLTINGDLVTGNYRVFVKDTVSGSGRFMQDGVNGGNGGNSGCGGGDEGGSAGSNGTAISGYFTTFAAPASGRGGFSSNSGSNGTSATSSIGVNGSASASGQTGGVSSTSTVFGILSWQTLAGLDITSSGLPTKLTPNSSSASPSGGGNNGGTGCEGAGSGGTGSGGGLLWLVANNWAGSFTMQAKGGNGGNGGNSSNSGTGIGNGGSGGPGGSSVAIYRNKTWTGTYALNGGTAGSAGTGTANAGTNGVAGITGVSYELPIFRLLK